MANQISTMAKNTCVPKVLGEGDFYASIVRIPVHIAIWVEVHETLHVHPLPTDHSSD